MGMWGYQMWLGWLRNEESSRGEAPLAKKCTILAPTSFARSKKPMDNLPAPQCSSVSLDPLSFTEFAGWESASLEPESPKRQRKRHPDVHRIRPAVCI